MPRLLTGLMALLLLIAFVPAQVRTVGTGGSGSGHQPPTHTKTVNEGWTVQDANGRKVTSNTSYCKVEYEGDATVNRAEKTITVGTITKCTVPSGASNDAHITCENVPQIDVDNNGTTITSNGDGDASNGGPDINVSTNNVTINANDKGTDIDVNSGCNGTTVNAGNDSGGTCNQSGGFNGTFNSGTGTGYGPWTIGA